MNIYPGAELWRRVYELGNQVGELWRLKHRSVKRTEKPSFPRCAYKTTDQPHGYPPCGRPAEHCETEPPTSIYMDDPRPYWLCRHHAKLRNAEEEWGNRIINLIEWEQAFDEARRVKTKEEVIAFIKRRCDERRRLCDEFAAYIDSVRYAGQGEHPLG